LDWIRRLREQGEETAKIKYVKILKRGQGERGSAVSTGTAHLVKYIDNRIDVRTAHAHQFLFVNSRDLDSKIYVLKQFVS